MLSPPRVRAATAALLLLTLVGCASEPSDDQLLRWFARERAQLEPLVQMCDEDFAARRVIRVAPSFTRLARDWGWPRPESEWGISRQRWDEYRRLFRRSGLSGGLNRNGEHYGQILFSRWDTGLLDNTRRRGVLFAHADPVSIRAERQTFDVRHIEGNGIFIHG